MEQENVITSTVTNASEIPVIDLTTSDDDVVAVSRSIPACEGAGAVEGEHLVSSTQMDIPLIDVTIGDGDVGNEAVSRPAPANQEIEVIDLTLIDEDDVEGEEISILAVYPSLREREMDRNLASGPIISGPPVPEPQEVARADPVIENSRARVNLPFRRRFALMSTGGVPRYFRRRRHFM